MLNMTSVSWLYIFIKALFLVFLLPVSVRVKCLHQNSQEDRYGHLNPKTQPSGHLSSCAHPCSVGLCSYWSIPLAAKLASLLDFVIN